MSRILYVVSELEDFLSSRLPVALAAKEDGFNISVAAPNAENNTQLAQYGFDGYDIPKPDQKLSVSAFKLVQRIDDIMREVQPDIVHAITLKYAFLTGVAARKNKKVQPVYTIAGLGYLFSGESIKPKIMRLLLRPIIRNVFRNAQIIVQNPDDERTLVRQRFIAQEQSNLVRGSGVDLQRFAPANTNEDAPIILMPTRLIHDKGIAVFIEAAKILKQRGIDARFQIAGGVTSHNPLAISQSEMEKMVANTNVEWIGKVSDMPALYKSCAVIVYPSYYGEGIPRVLLEAAACGRAIVTTDHPGCREAVKDGDNGLLVPVKNAQATADAIEKILKDKNLREQMEKRGRQRAESEFDINLIARQTADIYQKV